MVDDHELAVKQVRHALRRQQEELNPPRFTVDDLEVVFSLEMMRHSHRPPQRHTTGTNWNLKITELGKKEAYMKGMERREEYVGNGLLRSEYRPKQSIFASTDTDRTFATAIEFFQGFYPLESTQLASQPLQDIKQLFNPLENTQFTNMLTSSENQSQASIVTRIHRSRNPMHFDEVECPLISEFLKNDYFDKERVVQFLISDFGEDMVNKFRSQREVRRPDSEIEIRKVYLQLDRYLSDNYGKGEDLTEIKLMQTLIIAHNFLT